MSITDPTAPFRHDGKPVDLTTLTYDQVAFLFGHYQARSIDRSLTERQRTIAMNKRQRVSDAAMVRGLMIRPYSGGGFMCGPPSHFQPIGG